MFNSYETDTQARGRRVGWCVTSLDIGNEAASDLTDIL